MNIRKEKLVFAGSLALVGLLVYPSLGGDTRRPNTRGGAAPELDRNPVPAVDVALPVARDSASIERDLFSPPRDTRPLPPLQLEQPPLEQVLALRPPPAPGPRPRLFGSFLRASAAATPVPGLFATTAEEAEALDGDDDPDGEPAESMLDALKQLGYAESKLALTPEQRQAQLESWKRLYDWVRISEGVPQFGQIRNEDRFDLSRRPQEPIRFVEVDPDTGLERMPGIPPVEYTRDRVTEFAFAGTVANQIQLRRREFGESVTTSQYLPVLELADWCVEMRHQAPGALKAAEELYALAATVGDNDPAPRLGMARCYEAGFRFEEAYRVYTELLAGGYDGHAVVHARLGALEARFRLYESAERRFTEAERRERTNWEVQWSKGRFLLGRGRYAEALTALELAYKFEPGPERRSARVGIRLDLAAARLAEGNLAGPTGALAMYEAVLQAEPGQVRGLAGRRIGAYLEAQGAQGGSPSGTGSGAGASATGGGGTSSDDAGFELVLAQALERLQSGDAPGARDGLLAAADADPLRAHVAWRALSWLAETSGYPGEAQTWIERAYEADPTDPYTLYQLGRSRALSDDPEGAQAAFTAALDSELDFTDALVALGLLFHERGEHEAAERYYHRAVSLDDQRAEVHARRAFNLLGTGDARAALASFEEASRLEPSSAAARSGIAWCNYLAGDSPEAIAQFAVLDDQRRSQPDEDPWRVYARSQMERITKHDAKEAWTDRFERKTLKNGWEVEESAGPIFSMVDGTVVLDGSFKQSGGLARMYRRYSAPLFVSIEMDVIVDPTTKARVSVLVSKERPRRQGGAQVLGQIAVERHSEGGLQVQTEDRRSSTEAEREDVPPVGGVAWWPADRVVRLRIEKVGEGSDAVGRISVDGIPVRDGFSLRSLSSSGDLFVGLAAEGDLGRLVRVVIDNVEVVYQRPN